MAKYRIVGKDKCYTVQKRYLLFFWEKMNDVPMMDLHRAVALANYLKEEEENKEQIYWESK